MIIAEPRGLAVVTGASSGIGAIYADRLAAAGHPLLLVARRRDKLDQFAAHLCDWYGVKVETLTADLSRPDELAQVEARLAEDPVAILINNAGAGGLGPTAQVGADKLETLVRLNVVALMRLSLAALTGFRQRDAGVLVNIGSIVAHSPTPRGAGYSGSKAFVMAFTRSLQLEYAETGVRIQLVMPGPVRTEFFTSQGMSDAVFPDEMFITAEQLVDAAIAGLAAGEAVTSPSVADPAAWDALEAARKGYLAAASSGQVAPRYGIAAEAAAQA